ncbi:porin [Rhodobacterales bacterium HKCCA1065]|nr:porin [Rhodobacterales bacterium HKCCA1065]
MYIKIINVSYDSESSIFATTALALSAGAAVADVAVSGDGRMGIVNISNAVGADVQFSSRLRIAFTASGTTDGGLEFGGSVRADNAANGAAGTAGSVFISGGFGKLTIGDIDTAAEKAVGDVAGVGYQLTTQEAGFLGGALDEGVLYEYSINGLGVKVSAGQIQANSANNEAAIGLTYSIGGVSLGYGYSDSGTTFQNAFSIGGSVAGLGLKAVWLENEDCAAVESDGSISATYAFTPALSGTVFHREQNGRTAANDGSATGIGFAYNLGGGASLKAGFVGTEVGNVDGDTADFGLTFSF